MASNIRSGPRSFEVTNENPVEQYEQIQCPNQFTTSKQPRRRQGFIRSQTMLDTIAALQDKVQNLEKQNKSLVGRVEILEKEKSELEAKLETKTEVFPIYRETWKFGIKKENQNGLISVGFLPHYRSTLLYIEISFNDKTCNFFIKYLNAQARNSSFSLWEKYIEPINHAKELNLYNDPDSSRTITISTLISADLNTFQNLLQAFFKNNYFDSKTEKEIELINEKLMKLSKNKS